MKNTKKGALDKAKPDFLCLLFHAKTIAKMHAKRKLICNEYIRKNTLNKIQYVRSRYFYFPL